MRLLSARFQNFRLLRDLELEFAAADPAKRLTVIRAPNETGKTTLLTALQWALYGDAALPNRGDGFRLHPIDWASGGRVPITVTVDFEVVRYNKIAGAIRESRRRYRLIRSTSEEIRGTQWTRSAASVKLLALTETGAAPVDAPESMIADELPPELRDVFFTDGDRTLSFIESDVAVSTKRERVQRAIRSLLGLGIIEDAIRHVRTAAGHANKSARQLGGNTDVAKVAAQLEALADAIGKCEQERSDANEQFVAFDEKLSEIERRIDEALKHGDREKLQRDLETAKKSVVQLDGRVLDASKDHSALFRSEDLARDLLAPVLAKAFRKLDELHDRGKIPNTTIPVLQERLLSGVCICGETLVEDGGDGSTRRRHIEGLVATSRGADAIQEIVTDLYYGSRSLEQQSGNPDAGWLARYTKVVAHRDSLQNLRAEAGRRLKGLELQLDSIPSTDIQGLREVRRQYLSQRDRFNAARSRAEAQLDSLTKEKERLTLERDKLLREQKKGARILSELEAVKDIGDVLQGAYERITHEELAKVSDLMNRVFLEMIGADPEQRAIIRKAEISPEFDILVFGPEDRSLNPDLDLNGASRRALTLAFILALTRVSDVEAPNVIDTPLGMMSGYVKRAVLKAALRESSQLVLFLTPSEITGCEEIIDEHAERVITLTNTAHFPKMLVNDPGWAEQRILRCSCDHRQACPVCERRAEADVDLVLTV